MIYYFKDGKWTAVSSQNSRYWELHGFNNCKKLELCTPAIQGFGWGGKENGYKKKDFTTEEFKAYMEQYRNYYLVMLERIDFLLGEIEVTK